MTFEGEVQRPMPPDPSHGPLADAFRAGRRVHLRPGAVVFTEGDASSRVLMIESGRVKVSIYGEGGQETVLGFRGPGAVLGELAAIDESDHMATVAVVEEGEAWALPAEAFVRRLETEPGLALALLRHIASRLREADGRRAEYGTTDVTARVARRLLDLVASDGEPSEDGTRITLAISQRELAGWVGSSREAVNKSLAQLEGAGLVRRDGRRLVVRDVDGLRRRAR